MKQEKAPCPPSDSGLSKLGIKVVGRRGAGTFAMLGRYSSWRWHGPGKRRRAYESGEVGGPRGLHTAGGPPQGRPGQLPHRPDPLSGSGGGAGSRVLPASIPALRPVPGARAAGAVPVSDRDELAAIGGKAVPSLALPFHEVLLEWSRSETDASGSIVEGRACRTRGSSAGRATLEVPLSAGAAGNCGMGLPPDGLDAGV